MQDLNCEKGKKVKLGYVKTIKGEVPVDVQIQHLRGYGVDEDKIYNGDEEHENIFEVINSFQ